MSRKRLHAWWKSRSGPESSNTPWVSIGLGKDYLAQELERLYWEGARHELENILCTLKIWQQPEYAAIIPADEDDTHIHGYDTFLGQVNQQARAFAIRSRRFPITYITNGILTHLGEEIMDGNRSVRVAHYLSHREAIRAVAVDSIAERSNNNLKAEVRKNLSSVQTAPLPRMMRTNSFSVTKALSGIEERARLLMQTAGELSESYQRFVSDWSIRLP